VPGGIPSARDAAKRIEAQQRDLTELLGKVIKLRRERFSGKMVVVFNDGKAAKVGLKQTKQRTDGGGQRTEGGGE